jgi:TolA-binding protein
MGDKFKQEGEKAMNRTTIFGFGKQQKYEDAAAAFIKAGNAYKLSKEWNEAAEMFIKAANCQKETDSKTDACNSYVEAGGCFAKVISFPS